MVKGQAEIEGLDSLVALFSKRKEQIERRYERELSRWRERHPDRNPTLKEQCRLRDHAALASRQRKRGAKTLEALRAGWLGAAPRPATTLRSSCTTPSVLTPWLVGPTRAPPRSPPRRSRR